jgi:phosphoglycolate phosphatase
MNADASTLVFDLDGTLVHSAPDLHAALNRVLDEAGRNTVTLNAVIAMIGDGVPTLVTRGFAATGGPPDDLPAWLARFHVVYAQDSATLTTLYPGVMDTLEALKSAGHRMAICTNKPIEATQAVLQSFNLARFFDAVAGGDSLPVRKPSPGHLLGVLAMMNAGPERAVMIGDSPTDVATALNAGVPVIAVAYGYRRVPAADLGADVLIENFSDLPAALAQLEPITHGGA